jgi:hypothetical protein
MVDVRFVCCSLDVVHGGVSAGGCNPKCQCPCLRSNEKREGGEGRGEARGGRGQMQIIIILCSLWPDCHCHLPLSVVFIAAVFMWHLEKKLKNKAG